MNRLVYLPPRLRLAGSKNQKLVKILFNLHPFQRITSSQPDLTILKVIHKNPPTILGLILNKGVVLVQFILIPRVLMPSHEVPKKIFDFNDICSLISR